MNTSSSIATLAPALLKAQRAIGGAIKAGNNPHFKAAFATLGDVIFAAKAALNENGISALQMVGHEAGVDYVETVLVHECGEFISSKMRVAPAKANDPQALGSALSYSKRYALQSALLIPSVDDDGEAAMFRQGDSQVQDDRPSWEDQTAPKTPTGASVDFRQIRIHFGKNRGLMLAELTPQQIRWYQEDWLPKKEVAGPGSVEDLALVHALKDYSEWQKNGKQ